MVVSETKTLLYTGAFRFPDHDAAAFRVLSIAELLKSNGQNVVFAGWERPPSVGQHYVHGNYDCFSQDEFRYGTSNPFRRLLGFMFRGRKTVRWIWKNRDNFDAVIAYNPPVFFSLMLLLIGKFVPFKVILDCTEWYESAHLPGGRFGLAALENWLRMNFVYKLFDNVICISAFLENHFTALNSVRIPPMLPDIDRCQLERPDILLGINFIYAGEAGQKDRLTRFISRLPRIQELIRNKIQIHIVGMTRGQLSTLLVENCLDENKLSKYIVCHGRISREEVFQLYDICHFSVLFRDHRRYAIAGFPTKAMESLHRGCPMITNAVGDLSECITHELNAFVLEESQLEQLLPGYLSHASSNGNHALMVDSAKKAAELNFSPAVYQERLAKFIDACFVQKFKG